MTNSSPSPEVLKTFAVAYRDPQARSQALYARAERVMPGGNTRHAIALSPYPVYVARGAGCRVTDVEGEERVDFLNNFTSLILGHADPDVTKAAQARVALGTAFAAPTEADVELAERLVERVPSLERLRYCNSGSEAVLLAVKAARAFTGRPALAKIAGAYHGIYDYAQVSEGPAPDQWGPAERPASVTEPGCSPRVCEDVVVLPWNDADACVRLLEEHRHRLAGLIVDARPRRLPDGTRGRELGPRAGGGRASLHCGLRGREPHGDPHRGVGADRDGRGIHGRARRLRGRGRPPHQLEPLLSPLSHGGVARAIMSFGGEIERPRRNIPLTLAISFPIIMLTYTAVVVAVPGLLPWQQLAVTKATVSEAAMVFLPRSFAAAITMGAVFAIATSINGLILAKSRDLFALGVARVLPDVFATVGPRYGEPRVALLTMGAVAVAGVMLGRSFSQYASMAVLCLMLHQILTAIALLRLRARMPEQYAAAGFKLGPRGIAFWGTGLIACSLVFIVAGLLGDPAGGVIYVATCGLGAVIYALRRRHLRREGVSIEELLLPRSRSLAQQTARPAAAS